MVCFPSTFSSSAKMASSQQKLTLKLKKDKKDKRPKPYPAQQQIVPAEGTVVEEPIHTSPNATLTDKEIEALFGNTSDITPEEEVEITKPKCPIHENELTPVSSKDGDTVYLKCENKCGFFCSTDQLYQ